MRKRRFDLPFAQEMLRPARHYYFRLAARRLHQRIKVLGRAVVRRAEGELVEAVEEKRDPALFEHVMERSQVDALLSRPRETLCEERVETSPFERVELDQHRSRQRLAAAQDRVAGRKRVEGGADQVRHAGDKLQVGLGEGVAAVARGLRDHQPNGVAAAIGVQDWRGDGAWRSDDHRLLVLHELLQRVLSNLEPVRGRIAGVAAHGGERAGRVAQEKQRPPGPDRRAQRACCRVGDRGCVGRASQGVAEHGERGEMSAPAVGGALRGQCGAPRVEDHRGRHLQGDRGGGRRHQERHRRVRREENQAGGAQGDLVALRERVLGDRGAVDQGVLAAAGIDEEELVAAGHDRAVRTADREIRQLQDIAFSPADPAPGFGDLQLETDVGPFDDDEARTMHGVNLHHVSPALRRDERGACIAGNARGLGERWGLRALASRKRLLQWGYASTATATATATAKATATGASGDLTKWS